MAEAVNRHFESMAEEFEEIRRCKLFTDEELKVIKKRLKEYDYKINAKTKSLSDYKAYIEYEKFFLSKIQVRRNKHRVYDRKQSIEYKIIKRMKTLYEIAIMRFPNDYSFSMKFFEFCKHYNFHQVASHQLKQMVMLFSNKVEIFQVAAEWFTKRDKTQALNYLHKGLLLHPKSEPLYLDAIHLELREFQKDEKYDTELGCNRLMRYIESIFKNIDKVKFILDVLILCEQQEFTEKVQNFIIKNLLEKYSDDECVWDAIAKRELRGIPYNLPENVVPSKHISFLLDRVIKTYMAGLETVKNRKDKLWSLYLDTLIEIQKQNPNVEKNKKLNALRSALEKAASSNVKLEERHFAAWIEIYVDNETEVLQILEKASIDLPESVLLWELYLKFYILKDDSAEVNKVFKRAILALKENAEPIWFIIINYHLLRSKPDTVEAIYLDAIKEPERISTVFKPEYINWLILMRGIEEARAAYDSIATSRPYCKQLHIAMAKAESLEAMEESMERWEKCLKLACEQFGTDNIDVWLQYIELYLVHHKVVDANEKIQKIFRDAENTLLPILKDHFKEEFNNLLAETPLI